jgi:beta-glucanase (GH16 family)
VSLVILLALVATLIALLMPSSAAAVSPHDLNGYCGSWTTLYWTDGVLPTVYKQTRTGPTGSWSADTTSGLVQTSNSAFDTTPPQVPTQYRYQVRDALGSSNWFYCFRDEFSSDTLSSYRNACWEWNSCLNGARSRASYLYDTGEDQCYDPSYATLSSGVLHLKADTPDCTKEDYASGCSSAGPNAPTEAYTSALVTTSRSSCSSSYIWAQRYGSVEISAKPPTGQGFWSQLYMNPVPCCPPATEAQGDEIDILEHLGKSTDVNVAYQSLHTHGESSGTTTGSACATSPSNCTTGYHTYGIEWTPSQIQWKLDGYVKKTVTSSERSIPDEYMNLILTLVVGGSWPGDASDTTPFPSNFDIEYIRASTSDPLNP